ncbi:kinase-like domain-containing protein [Tanacetum coccineum]
MKTGAIYRTEVCTKVFADVIYPNKVISEPGYDKQRQKMGYIRRKTSREYTNYLLSAKDRCKGRGYDRGYKAEKKQVEIMEDRRDKKTVKDCIIDSGALFYATYCKEELERFKLRSGMVCLANDKILDIVGVGDVVLKTFFGTSWTQKDVRYIPGLKRRNKRGSLYMVEVHLEEIVEYINGSGSAAVWFGKAEESFLHNVNEDKETAKVKCLKSGNGEEYSRKPIKFCVENGIVMLKMVPETPLQFGVAERLSQTFKAESMGLRVEAPKMLWEDSVSTAYLIYRIPYVSIGLCIPKNEWCGKDTSLTHLKAMAQMKCDIAFGIRRVTRLSEVEILHLWTRFMELENDSIVAEHGLSLEITQSTGGSSDTSEGSENSRSFEDSRRSDEEYSKDGASSKEGGSETPHVRRSTRESRAPVRYSPSANYFLLIENGKRESYSEALSSKESVQWKKAINEEMVKKEQNGSKRYKARLMVKGFQQKRGLQEPSYVEALNDTSTQHKKRGFSASWAERKPRVQIEGNYVRTDSSIEATMKDRCSKKQMLGYVLTVDITIVEWESRLQKSITINVHQVGDEIEVKVMRSFNRPPSKLITEDGVLPKRVHKGWSSSIVKGKAPMCVAHVGQPQVNPDLTIAQVEQITPFRSSGTGGSATLDHVASCIIGREAYCSTGFEGRIVGCKPNPTSFSTGRAVWHEPEQFSSELNNISGLIPWTAMTILVVDTMSYIAYRGLYRGNITSSLGECISLTELYLNGNIFQGIIASSLSSLRGLEVLDIFQNNLSSKIPQFLDKWKSLEYLNLSFNDFEVEVPVVGVFVNASAFSVVGNNRLYGGLVTLELPKHKKRFPFLTLVIVIAPTLLIILCCVYLLCKKRRNSQPSQSGSEQFMKVSYNQLLKATDGFSATNLIGEGGFSSVYKGILDYDDDKFVAIKVLHLRNRGAHKSFLAECKAWRNIRHRNLLKIITSCSSVDFQGNDFKALVYEFLPNGSVHDWLHSRSNTSKLNLLQRINILKDVATPLDYLHNRCQTTIVHGDLKPSNILLDDDMVAHVGDFGLSRLLGTDLNPYSSTGDKGTIGYARYINWF